MTVDPRYRDSWQGFVDLMRPPSGYRLTAAFGTAFGLSFEALVAALLAMMHADGERLAHDPAAAVIAMTRLRDRVRVLVHPATISTPGRDMPKRLIALLDSFISEVRPKGGLFHPKVWALRFTRIGSESDERGRIIVCSRNLTGSRSFEFGTSFEGRPAASDESPSPFVHEVESAIRTWVALSRARVPSSLRELTAFVGNLVVDLPHEAREGAHFHWQAPGRAALDRRLPPSCERAIVVSPFVRPEFVSAMLERTKQLHIVSTAECLDALDDAIFSRIEARRALQRSPVLYQIGEYGDPDGAFLDGLHAKLVIVDGPSGASTFVGSANATGPAWGLAQTRNVEAMVELRPGIPFNTFMKSFILETRDKLHPWVAEYDRDHRDDCLDAEIDRQLLSALRDVGAVELTVRFTQARQTLEVSLAHPEGGVPLRKSAESLQFDFAPLSISDDDAAWRPLASLASGPIFFEGIDLPEATAFVAIRARRIEPPAEKIRIVLGRLEMSDEELGRRDQAARSHLLAGVDPSTVLEALVRGVAFMRSGPASRALTSAAGGGAIHNLLQHTSLELLLQAVALDRSLVGDLRTLIGPFAEEPFQAFCMDLEEACATVSTERFA